MPRRAHRVVFTVAAAAGFAGLLLYAGLAAGVPRPVVIDGTAVPPLPTLAPAAVARGAALYAQHCADCHGGNLQGAPDWKTPLADGSYPPPPHDASGHTWHHTDELLLQIIAQGGLADNSRMPAFGDRLTRPDMEAILAFIKSHWGRAEREFQWWISAREQ